jgi:hypothetical protein
LIEESLRLIRVQQVKMKEEIKRLEQEEKQLKTRIIKFNRALEDEDDTSVIKVLAKQIGDTEEKQLTNFDALAKSKIEAEQLNEKYSNTEMSNVYYNVKERIVDFFKKMNIEEQRDCLIRTIRECLVFGQYLIIDTGFIIFIFDTSTKYQFDKSLLKNLDSDEIYKKYFVEVSPFFKSNSNKTLKEAIDEIGKSGIEEYTHLNRTIHKMNDMLIRHYRLDDKERKNSVIKLLKRLDIDYDIQNHYNFVSFIDKYEDDKKIITTKRKQKNI